ncbi:unnamed protein product, partial [Trichogramma brassicae]
FFFVFLTCKTPENLSFDYLRIYIILTNYSAFLFFTRDAIVQGSVEFSPWSAIVLARRALIGFPLGAQVRFNSPY